MKGIERYLMTLVKQASCVSLQTKVQKIWQKTESSAYIQYIYFIYKELNPHNEKVQLKKIITDLRV